MGTVRGMGLDGLSRARAAPPAPGFCCPCCKHGPFIPLHPISIPHVCIPVYLKGHQVKGSCRQRGLFPQLWMCLSQGRIQGGCQEWGDLCSVGSVVPSGKHPRIPLRAQCRVCVLVQPHEQGAPGSVLCSDFLCSLLSSSPWR